MPRYIAFLRGINIGGHRVKMDRLGVLFQDLGFDGVSTFIASGNVIFSSADADLPALEAAIERHLAGNLGYEVPTFLRTPTRLEEIVSGGQHQEGEAGESDSSCYVILLRAPASPEVRSALEEVGSEMDEFRFSGSEAFWSIQGKLSESPLFSGGLERILREVPYTMRNMNTLRRLVEKVRGR